MSVHPCFHPCVHPFTLSNINISATSRLITKCYQKHHLGMGSLLGFGPDQIRILVSLATDSSHRVLMGKTVLPLFSRLFFRRSFSFIVASNKLCMGAPMSLKFGQIQPSSAELAAIERLKKTKNPHTLTMGKTVLPPFLSSCRS